MRPAAIVRQRRIAVVKGSPCFFPAMCRTSACSRTKYAVLDAHPEGIREFEDCGIHDLRHTDAFASLRVKRFPLRAPVAEQSPGRLWMGFVGCHPGLSTLALMPTIALSCSLSRPGRPIRPDPAFA